MPTRIEGDVYINGNMGAATVSLPTSSVSDGNVTAGANIDATKLEHQHRLVLAQESATTAADATQVVHIVTGLTGDVVSVSAGSVVANIGDSTVAIDVLKNGASILSAPISLDSGDSAYDLVAGTISSAALAQDDVLEVDIDATVGTGTLATGVFVQITLHEKAQ